MKKTEEYSGKWYIPEFSENKISGRLIIDIINSTQVLKLYTEIDFKGHNAEFNSRNTEEKGFFNDQYPTIYGNCGVSSYITLTNCKRKGLKRVGGDLFYEVSISITFSYQGGLFLDESKIKCYRLTCKFPYLATWYDTDRKFFGDSTAPSMSFEGFNKPSLTNEQLVDEIVINENLTIEIKRLYECLEGNDFLKSKITLKHFVIFKCKNPVPLENLKNLAFKFLRLMMLCIGKVFTFDFISLISESIEQENQIQPFNISQDKQFMLINFFSQYHRRNLVKDEYINKVFMLVYGGVPRHKDLENLIRNWFNNYDRFYMIYETYLETQESFYNTKFALSQKLFYNRYLNLIQSLENYYDISNPKFIGEKRKVVEKNAKQILSQIKDENDINWILDRIEPLNRKTLRSKIKEIIRNDSPIFKPEVFENSKQIDKFVGETLKFRNSLSHGSKIELEAHQIITNYNKTKIIVVCCILNNLGFRKDFIKPRLLKTWKYRDLIDSFK